MLQSITKYYKDKEKSSASTWTNILACLLSILKQSSIYIIYTKVAEHSDRASYEMLSEDKAVPDKRDGLLNGVDFQVSLRVNAVVSADILPCKHPFLQQPPECPGC